MNDKKSLGQFFTPQFVSDFMVSLTNKPLNAKILEPSAGEGVFLSSLNNSNYKNVIAYEIDKSLTNYSPLNINYESFIDTNISNIDLAIGNPPYIRWKNIPKEMKEELQSNHLWNKYFNSLCDYLYIFILKSIEALKEDGELIFITPEYWMHTTHSLTLRNYMLENGFFETIIHFKETPIFDKVASSIVIFKYIKSSKKKKSFINYTEYNSRLKLTYELLLKIKNMEQIEGCKYFQLKQFQKDSKWLFADNETLSLIEEFEEKCSVNIKKQNLFDSSKKYIKLGDIARIGNGMVSGLDKAFQLPNDIQLNDLEKSTTILVSKAKHLSPYQITDTVRYIFFKTEITEEKLKLDYPNFYYHLSPFIEKLEKRYKYNKTINYWEWVFLRNYDNLFSKNQEKIFIPCKERISHKNHVRFAFANSIILPTQDVTAIYINNNIQENIYYILALLNNKRVFHWLKYNGIIKGNILEFSEKPTSQIPIKMIDWDNDCEVTVHNNIVSLVKEYLKKNNQSLLENINFEIDKLFHC